MPPGSSILKALTGHPQLLESFGYSTTVKVNSTMTLCTWNLGECKMRHSQQPAGVPVLTTGGKQPRDPSLPSDGPANGETEAPGKWMSTHHPDPDPGCVPKARREGTAIKSTLQTRGSSQAHP